MGEPRLALRTPLAGGGYMEEDGINPPTFHHPEAVMSDALTIDLTPLGFKPQTVVRWPGPFSPGPKKIIGVICEDGTQRTADCSSQGADTFFSIPARVRANGKTVAGYVTYETLQGYSTESPDDPGVYKFVAYKYRRNWREVAPLDAAIPGSGPPYRTTGGAA